jgi:hypothetical protein
VLAAFHVYVHLALFCTVAEERAPQLSDKYGPLDRMTRSRDALQRAHYLAEQLRAVCWPELGLAGRSLVDWFSSVLEVLDPSPPPPGSYIHLLFDRYLREAREIENHPRSDRERSDLQRQLTALVREEARLARDVLAAVGADLELSRFNDAFGQFSEEDLGVQFAKVRSLISKAILGVSPGGYGWQHTLAAPDQMVERLIEISSETLRQLLDVESKPTLQVV